MNQNQEQLVNSLNLLDSSEASIDTKHLSCLPLIYHRCQIPCFHFLSHRCTRQVFESNLAQEGLVLSRHEHFETGLHFVKIHAPTEVLKRYAEILKLRFPMKKVRSTRLKYQSLRKEAFISKLAR